MRFVDFLTFVDSGRTEHYEIVAEHVVALAESSIWGANTAIHVTGGSVFYVAETVAVVKARLAGPAPVDPNAVIAEMIASPECSVERIAVGARLTVEDGRSFVARAVAEDGLSAEWVER